MQGAPSLSGVRMLSATPHDQENGNSSPLDRQPVAIQLTTVQSPQRRERWTTKYSIFQPFVVCLLAVPITAEFLSANPLGVPVDVPG